LRNTTDGRSTIADAFEVALPQTAAGAEVVPLGHPALWRASIVIPTHNDGANIGRLIQLALAEPSVGEVIVIASGCTDDTVDAVRMVAAASPGRVRLFVESERSGKSCAINFAVTECRFDHVVIVSGDVSPIAGALEALIGALDEDGVGMAGGRPVPVNDDNVMGVAVRTLWQLHHRLAAHRPKLGEAIAVRAAAIAPLPLTSVDEATFQAQIEKAGWRSRYVPQAIIYNRGPQTARDFVLQRRRAHAGHLRLRRTSHYTVPSLEPMLLAREFAGMLIGERHELGQQWLRGVAAAIGLEACARVLAHCDDVRRKDAHVWKMVESAKDPGVGPDGVDVGRGELVAGPGLAAPSSDQRDGEHQLPLQLHVRDVQRLRAQGRRTQR
jgi:glycosyltransferase involved in cell wall biosynthesis